MDWAKQKSGAKAQITFFDEEGDPTGLTGVHQYLPDFLDWMPIKAKIFWFLQRGMGDPRARIMLFSSQGEQRIALIETPLQQFDQRQLKERENDLEILVSEFCRREGISRTPRNQ